MTTAVASPAPDDAWHCPTCGLVLHTGAWFGIHPPRCERCNPTTTHTQTVTTGSPGSTATLKVHAGAVISSGTTVSVPAMAEQQPVGPDGWKAGVKQVVEQGRAPVWTHQQLTDLERRVRRLEELEAERQGKRP